MPDKKPTDNKIKKALECCIKSSHFGECFDNKCPLVSEKGCMVGKETLYPYALDLINHLQAENERLTIRLRKVEHQLDDACKMYQVIKSEACKEFAELSIKKICEQVSAPTPSESYIVEKCNQVIDNLSKELVGE